MNQLIRCACVVFTLVLATDVIAQASPPSPPAVCENNPGFDQWDFWVGEWNVYTNDESRTLSGTNSITKHYANCLIQETWMSAGGSGGFSINYYNPVRGQWRQVWVSNGYSIDYTGGLNEQGQMVLEGELDNYALNNSAPFRGTWMPQENGEVVQRFEIYNAGTDSWSIWFEGRYVKQ
jgi:hypothetical protein